MANITINSLLSLIESKQITIGIFGAGYVGLPLACSFAETGFHTVACDTDGQKIAAIRQGRSYIEDNHVRLALPNLTSSGQLAAEENVTVAATEADFAILTVPTPLNGKGDPDLSYLLDVTQKIADKIRPGKFVIVESSVYPGTTEEIIKPVLERSGLAAGIDFGLAYSPERIDYGNVKFGIGDIPKVVGGITPLCTEIASRLYKHIIRAGIVQTSNMRTAEATKMLENTYRYVNIALANELAILHEQLGIDFFEVVQAASSKPFGFQAFYPGLGVGGHCIPKDPHYLSFKARQLGITLHLIEISQRINEGMTHYVIQRLESYLKRRKRGLQGSQVTILGLAFKADVSDTRNSPSARLAELLMERGAKVTAYDPLARKITVANGVLESAADLETALTDSEIIILATPHSSFRNIDLSKLRTQSHADILIVDTRGFWSPSECTRAGFGYVGLGRP